MTVAFIGVDGSGKSTLAARTAKWLADTGLQVSHCKVRSGRSGLERHALELGYRDLCAFAGADSAILMMAALTWQSIRDTKSAQRVAGAIVVYDRYTHCVLALAKMLAPGSEAKARELFSMLPKAKKVFFVTVDPEIAAARLAERGGRSKSHQFLHDFDAAYRSLPEAEHFIIIDGNQTPNAMFESVRCHFKI